MSQWPEDVSSCTLEELAGCQVQNRQWNWELRRRTKSLVQSRLAEEITRDDYIIFRQLTNEDSLECRRRARLLHDQVLRLSGASAAAMPSAL
jgi:hypothetical protein